eukprot:331847-Pleurochrysis_carterae.AAC.2
MQASAENRRLCQNAFSYYFLKRHVFSISNGVSTRSIYARASSCCESTNLVVIVKLQQTDPSLRRSSIVPQFLPSHVLVPLLHAFWTPSPSINRPAASRAPSILEQSCLQPHSTSSRLRRRARARVLTCYETLLLLSVESWHANC